MNTLLEKSEKIRKKNSTLKNMNLLVWLVDFKT